MVKASEHDHRMGDGREEEVPVGTDVAQGRGDSSL